MEELRARLTPHGQEHLIKYWDDLSSKEKDILAGEIKNLDLEEVTKAFSQTLENSNSLLEKADDLQPIPDDCYESVPEMPKEMIEKYERMGFEEISEGKVGVLLLAGGQATRLGFGHPKGMYNVGLPSQKTLFQIQAERILRLQEMAKEITGKTKPITWYIMTSEHTKEPTLNFFKKHSFFGLNENDVLLFNQGRLPCFDFEGKILLDEKYHISTAPDGNGGLYKALKVEGILNDITKRGIKHLHAHSVDNILIKVADPVFIGYCKSKDADCALKVVRKTVPSEAVGVVCKVNGNYKVVEYSELTDEAAERQNSDGKLTFSAGNICNHYFSADFLNKISTMDMKLHSAKKKIPYIDCDGQRQKPVKPNGIKMEKFIFDVLEYSERFVCLEVAREVEFSALKNADEAKKDCPSTARQDLLNLHHSYVRAAGGVIPDGVEVEISPLLSYGGENLETVVKNAAFNISSVHLKSSLENDVACNGLH